MNDWVAVISVKQFTTSYSEAYSISYTIVFILRAMSLPTSVQVWHRESTFTFSGLYCQGSSVPQWSIVVHQLLTRSEVWHSNLKQMSRLCTSNLEVLTKHATWWRIMTPLHNVSMATENVDSPVKWTCNIFNRKLKKKKNLKIMQAHTHFEFFFQILHRIPWTRFFHRIWKKKKKHILSPCYSWLLRCVVEHRL